MNIKSCINSGFCCTQAPCLYGEALPDRSCKYLTPADENLRRFCSRYDWIVANVPDYHLYPAFGSGCSSTIGNTFRKAILELANTE